MFRFFPYNKWMWVTDRIACHSINQSDYGKNEYHFMHSSHCCILRLSVTALTDDIRTSIWDKIALVPEKQFHPIGGCVWTTEQGSCFWHWYSKLFCVCVIIHFGLCKCVFRLHQTCAKVPSCVTLLTNASAPVQQQRSFLPGFSNPFGGKSKKLVYTEQTLLG